MNVASHLEGGGHCGFLCKCRIFTTLTHSQTQHCSSTKSAKMALKPPGFKCWNFHLPTVLLMGRMRVRVKMRMGMVLRVTGRGHISQWAPYYYATHLRQHVHANLDLLNSTYTMCQPAISQCLIDWVKWVTGEALEKLSQCKNVLWRWGRMVECCKIIPATDCIGKPHFKINRKQFSNANPYIGVGVCNRHNNRHHHISHLNI